MVGQDTTVLERETGECAVDLARKSMESYVVNGKRKRPGCMEEEFYRRLGVLVKLQSTRGMKRVRGSAGSYHRDKQFSQAIVDATIEASNSDSGMSEIKNCELDSICVTLCALHSIDEVEDGYESKIEIGKHGLIVEEDGVSGWMLPTMPIDNNWSPTEFLDRTCCKAGLGKGAWMRDSVSVYAFEGQIFKEKTPEGEVEEVQLTPNTSAEAEAKKKWAFE